MVRQRILAMLMIITVMGLYAGDAVDFSGTWLPDDSKNPSAEEGPRMMPKKITVTQEGNALTTDKFLSNPMMGDFTVSEALTLDGNECVSETEFGTRKSTAVWSEDMKTLTIKSLMIMNWDGQERQMNSQEIWSLDEDLLKIEATRDTPMGTREDVLYFKKSQE